MKSLKSFQKIKTLYRQSFYVLGAIVLAASSIMLGQVLSGANKSKAANTLLSTSSQVITPATTDGLQPNGTYVGYGGSSKDGNVVLFSSNATNLPSAGSTTHGLYIYNLSSNTTARVDVSSSGVLPNGAVYSPVGTTLRVSETGRYITFASKATNLIDGTTTPSNYYSIFMRDTQLGLTTLVAFQPDTTYWQNYTRNLGISNDGRFILLGSRYHGGGYPHYYKTALGDNVTGAYVWTSLGQGSVIEGGYDNTNLWGSMSCDGAFVVFHGSGHTINLVDTRRGSNVTIDQSTGGSSSSPVISCNGRYVLYATTGRTQITPTPSGMNSNQHLVRYDRITGERKYIDSDSSGIFGAGFVFSIENENIFKASISDKGDVVFKFANNNSNMYLKHLSDGSGTLESIGMTTSGSYVNITSFSEITGDGRYIFFSKDPYSLGLAPSASTSQIIRVKTNL